MKNLTLIAALATFTVCATVSYGATSSLPEASDVQTEWSNLNACLKQSNDRHRLIHDHLQEMEGFSRRLTEGDPARHQGNKEFRELLKLTADLKNMYADYYARHFDLLNQLGRFRQAVDAEMPFNEGEVGECPNKTTR